MEDYQQIEQELITTLATEDTSGKVTTYGVTGSLRGFVTAVALKVRDLYYNISQTVRKLFLDSCTDSDLDNYANDHGVEARLGATKAGTIIVFKGAVDTVIPKGTQVKHSISNLAYETMQELTIGEKNPDFVNQSGNSLNDIYSIADTVWAECTQAGAIGNCPAGAINKCSVTGVTAENVVPAQGGTDIESDEAFRDRIRNYVKLLNLGTSKFYEETCKEADDRVLRAYPYKNTGLPDTINIVLVNKSGGLFTGKSNEKNDLPLIATLVEEKSRAFTRVICEHIVFTPIHVSFRVKLKSVNGQATNLDKYFQDVSDALAKYFDWSKWEWGKSVSLDDVLVLCENVPQTDDIDLLTFRVYTGDTPLNDPITLVNKKSLPYFSSVKVTDINAPLAPDNINPRINDRIKQNYEALQNQQNQS